MDAPPKTEENPFLDEGEQMNGEEVEYGMENQSDRLDGNESWSANAYPWPEAAWPW